MKTDVFGVYDRPPAEPNAVLLREIGEHIIYIKTSYTRIDGYIIVWLD